MSTNPGPGIKCGPGKFKLGMFPRLGSPAGNVISPNKNKMLNFRSSYYSQVQKKEKWQRYLMGGTLWVFSNNYNMLEREH